MSSNSDREARLLRDNDDMYRQIQKLRETVFKLKKYGEELLEVKVDPWFPESNRDLVSHDVGRKILKIIRGEI